MKKKLSDEIEGSLKSQVEAARSFIQSEIAPGRIKADKYRNGETELKHEEGRSKVIATPVSDTIRAVKPALMRLFLQTDPVEFVPDSAQAVQSAKHRTQMARYIFEREGGFMVLHDVFDDALVKGNGVAKVTWDEREEIEFDEYTGLSMEAAYYIAEQPDVEVEEVTQDEDGSVSMKVSRTTDKGRICIAALPPETFFINASAKNIESAAICGHAEEQTVGDLVALGFDLADVEGLDGEADDTEEQERFDRVNDDESSDPLMKKVLVTECYMKADIQKTGVPRLYKFILGGSSYKVLDCEPCDAVPFAVFEVDPVPHAFHGRSLATILIPDQDSQTSMERGLIDSINMANTPRVVALKGRVDVDSLLNNETGGVIWADQMDAVREFSIGGNAAQIALPALQYRQTRIEAKTGVQGVGMGLDADALQNQSATGAGIAERAAMGQTELIARTLAEGGMKQLFKLIDALVRQHPDTNRMMQVNGEFVEVDPRSWSADADVTVNVGLGTNRAQERAAAMASLVQMQMNLIQTMGPAGPLVGLAELRAGIAEMYRLQGIYDPTPYIKRFGPQEAQMMAQQAQQQPPQQQANPLAEAEMIKAQSKERTDAGKLQLEGQRAMMDDDFRRDEMAQKLGLEAAKIQGQHGLQVNDQAIRAQQAAPRF